MVRRSFLLLGLACNLLPAQVTLVSPDSLKSGGDVLPNEFAGWRAEKVEKFSLAGLPALAGDDAEVLREYGFLAAERKQYSRASTSAGRWPATGQRSSAGLAGERLTVEALRLRDSSGAYGVFTYYRQPAWRAESGKFYAAVGDGQAVLLRNSYCLRVAGQEPPREELALLAAALPTFQDEPLPPLRNFLPERGVVRNSLKYVMGPRVFSRLVPQIPSPLVGFNMGAEAQLARYRLPGKAEMTLLLVHYPTPQIAAARLKQFVGLEPALLQFRRTGSLISFVLGAPAEADADLLLERVNYSMDVVWNQPVPKHREPTLVELILNIFVLCGILAGFAFVSGLAFGGLRVVTKHFYPGLVFDREVEIISLNLSH